MSEKLLVTSEIASGSSAGPLPQFVRRLRPCAAATAFSALLSFVIPLLVREKGLRLPLFTMMAPLLVNRVFLVAFTFPRFATFLTFDEIFPTFVPHVERETDFWQPLCANSSAELQLLAISSTVQTGTSRSAALTRQACLSPFFRAELFFQFLLSTFTPAESPLAALQTMNLILHTLPPGLGLEALFSLPVFTLAALLPVSAA